MPFTHPLFASLLLASVTLTAAAQSPGCAAKQYEIRRKLDQAHAQQQHHQAAGLEKALHAAHAQCSDGGLQHARQRKVEQTQQEVRERQADLQEAQRQGDAQKILKRQNKLNQAHQERLKAERQQQK